MNTGFQGLPVSEVVPEAIPAMNDGMTKSSLLVGRRRIRFQPQTGTTAGPNSIVQFVLADSSSLLDVNSATISFKATVTGTNAAATPCALDDGVSWLRRLQVSLNGNLVEDIDNAHRLANMEVYASADAPTYQGALSFGGWWKFNPQLSNVAGGVASAGTGAIAYNPAFGDISGNASGGLWNAAGVRHAAGEDRVVPLSLLSGFFRTKQYIPLNLLGEMVLQFSLASNEEAILQSGATDGAYTLSDIFLECDVVTPHYMLAEMMNKVANSEGENGIVIPYESAIVSQGQAITASGQQSIIVSRATNNLRRLLYAHQVTAGLSSKTFPSVSCFAFNTTSSWQVRVGSYYAPSQPATTAPRMFSLLQSAYGEPINEKCGLINRNTYTTTTAAAGTASEGLQRNARCDSFIVGYGFDNFKNTGGTNVLDADGLSVLGQAGSQVVVQVTVGSVAVTPVVSLHATRYLSIMNGGLRIIGV